MWFLDPVHKIVAETLLFVIVIIIVTNWLIVFFFIDDLGDAKVTITELTRRLHEFELEVRRLENEREELTAAYKEAEAVSVFSALLRDSLIKPHS